MYNLEINTSFLYYINPERAVITAIFFFLLLLIIAPIHIINTLDVASLAYLILALSSFLLGTKLIRRNRIRNKVLNVIIEKDRILKIYRISTFLGILGVGFRYIDLLFVRGMSFFYSTLENFDSAIEGSGNLLSICSAFLIYFAFIPFTLDMIFRNLHTKKIKVLSLILMLSTALITLLTGSRNALMIPLLYGMIVFLYSKRRKFSLRLVVISAFVGLIVLNVIGSLFLKRLDDMKFDRASVMSEFEGYSNKVPANQNFVNFMQANEEKCCYTTLFAYLHVSQYFTHALFEFPIVKKHIDAENIHLYGKSTFGVFYRLFEKLFGLEHVDNVKYNARPGIWSTFFFNWYLDFGWLGIFFMFGFGVYCQYIWSKVYIKGNIFYLPLVIFLYIILLFILNLNMIAGAGTYALFAFIIFPRLCKIKYYRVLEIKKNE
ncbi:oligosaccharide repeat unit polymerase [Butyricimonas virosa]|uniref:Oligosaccharide repeat unit polymerase n=2 Tax=Butyricimonas virosa TaxID=544645 RepID=A0A412X1H5_9BACT|nr:O-antigen polymerase [Butyricimonas virosa]RGV34356.1 oligosaccharide repeat unit polymerase [Butyricimonas virosa]